MTPLKRRLAGIGLAAVAVPALLVSTTSTAWAHYQTVSQGYDYAVVYANHFSGAVCDKEADGHSVYAQYQTGLSIYTITDGGDAGCDYGNWSSDPASSFRVCEKVPNAKDYCSPWIYT
ncbi:hypothetical protein AB0J74_13625 [Asanoa sp. NPDC049573]|uniref:hypothetical protein n=1 Tax=Asanoa sp. NPDC049573 TaxID=3155396 RepID=UPI00344A0D8E